MAFKHSNAYSGVDNTNHIPACIGQLEQQLFAMHPDAEEIYRSIRTLKKLKDQQDNDSIAESEPNKD